MDAITTITTITTTNIIDIWNGWFVMCIAWGLLSAAFLGTVWAVRRGLDWATGKWL